MTPEEVALFGAEIDVMMGRLHDWKVIVHPTQARPGVANDDCGCALFMDGASLYEALVNIMLHACTGKP